MPAIHRYDGQSPSGVAPANPAFAARSHSARIPNFKSFLSRYFYFSMTVLMAAISLWGFSHTIDRRLLHAAPPRPLLLWFHAAAFSAWIVLFIVQSALVRIRKVKVHRTLGWFGAALAAFMVVSSLNVSVVMVRFDITVLHLAKVQPFLSVLWADMIIFAACMSLAIYFRKRPEYHRRLIFLASCQLMQAALVRFNYIGLHDLYFPALDLLILAGLLRDLAVDGRINKIYLYGFPSMIAMQSFAMYLARLNPTWWQSTTRSILGI